MVEVSEKLTLHVAHLARLELSSAEVGAFTSQLFDIIRYIDKLHEVDVQGVEPLTHPFDLPTFMREDTIQSSPVSLDGKPRVLQSAPDLLDDGFKVPPIL